MKINDENTKIIRELYEITAFTFFDNFKVENYFYFYKNKNLI